VRLKQSRPRTRVSREVANRTKQRIEKAKERGDRYRDLAVFYRAVGDGIAHTLFDRFDLKPLAFKERSGFVYRKEGGQLEMRILRAVLKRGVPAVLCDLTNCLRYGDLFVRSDDRPPLMLEVKSSKSSRGRAERQVAALERMSSYLTTDETENLYGRVGTTTRVSVSAMPTSHASEWLSLVDAAKVRGWALREVETGLYYIAVTRGSDELFEQYGEEIARCSLYMLNSSKFDGSWSGYVPFTKSLVDEQLVYSFAAGEVLLLVAYDRAHVQSKFAEVGCRLAYEPPGEGPDDPVGDTEGMGWWIEVPIEGSSLPARTAVSHHMIGRIAMEFVSLDWMIREMSRMPSLSKSALGADDR